MKNDMATNTLYYGDNLDWMSKWPGECIDLIYLDPPFNSKAKYNVLFGNRKVAQVQALAFEDTWAWSEKAAEDFDRAKMSGSAEFGACMEGFKKQLGQSGMLAYISHLAPRLLQMKRLLKPTGSLYLHCDPTASHYIKVLMDAVFGAKHFRNEIIWYYGGPSRVDGRFPRKYDSIFFYSKQSAPVFNKAYGNLPDYLYDRARKDDDGRLWVDQRLGELSPETIQKMEKEGRVFRTSSGKLRRKQYLDEMQGAQINDVWQIPIINSQSKERIGYPTQKPEALLKRIIKASSNEGYVVLDPYCGCGTTVHVAEQLKRRWIGIDITHLAIGVIEHRLKERLGVKPKVVGKPRSIRAAWDLFRRNPFQFESWIVSELGFLPNEKQVGDKGIDGRGYVSGIDEPVIVQVKGGKNVGPSAVRDLSGTVTEQKGLFGVLVVMENAILTKATKSALASGTEEVDGKRYPKLQAFSVEDYFAGKKLKLPRLLEGFTGRKPDLLDHDEE